MKITTSKIYKACSKNKDMPVLQAVHYNANKQRLEAADGWILAVCPVANANGDKEALFPADVVKEAHKMAARKGIDPILKVEPEGVRPGIVDYHGNTVCGYLAPFVEGNFPDVNQIVPREQDLEFLVALDAAKLHDLADAICDYGHGVALFQDPEDKMRAILVKPVGDSDNFGVIMPMGVNR